MLETKNAGTKNMAKLTKLLFTANKQVMCTTYMCTCTYMRIDWLPNPWLPTVWLELQHVVEVVQRVQLLELVGAHFTLVLDHRAQNVAVVVHRVRVLLPTYAYSK